MKQFFLTAFVALAIISCKEAEDKAIEPAPAATSDTVQAAQPMDSLAMAKAWESYATPGDAHAMMARETGTWNEETTFWMHAGDTKPMKTTMTAESKMILGGRYQEMRHTGDMMGMKFEGIGTMAYDNAAKKFVSSWIDNMGTGVMRTEAPWDGKSKTLEFKGTMTDPMTGKEKNVRELYTVVDENTRQMEMFDTAPDGTEYKSMEIVMRRK